MENSARTEIEGTFRRLPVVAAFGVLFLAVLWVLIPPWNLPFVLSGIPIGVAMFVVLVAGYRYRAQRAAWISAFLVLFGLTMAIAFALPPESASNSAGFL